MIPDLTGRWQTRVIVFGVAMLLILLLAALGLAPGGAAASPFLFLAYWLPVGLALDILYQALQQLRREGDWPLLLSIAGLGLEGLAIVGAMTVFGLPGLPTCLVERQDLALKLTFCVLPSIGAGDATLMVLWLSVAMVLVEAVLLPVLLPRWRFDGWRVLGRGRAGR